MEPGGAPKIERSKGATSNLYQETDNPREQSQAHRHRVDEFPQHADGAEQELKQVAEKQCEDEFDTSVAILAQVRIQALGLSFRCICHLGKPIKTRSESGFCLLCTSHGPGIQLGGQPLAGLVGKHSRDRTSLSQTSHLPKVRGKRETGVETPPPGMSRRSRNVSPAMSRKSSMVSWSDAPREQSEANGEDAVMEDGTETHQAEINKKIKARSKKG